MIAPGFKQQTDIPNVQITVRLNDYYGTALGTFNYGIIVFGGNTIYFSVPYHLQYYFRYYGLKFTVENIPAHNWGTTPYATYCY